jgi:hypothetical protein
LTAIAPSCARTVPLGWRARQGLAPVQLRMDFSRERRIGTADLAGAEAGGDVRATLSLPILKEQEIRRGRLVIHKL